MNRQQMLAPFADEELHTFKGRGGQDMTYIEDETVMDRLDLGFGQGNWQLSVDAVSESVVKVRLSVRESGEWVSYEDFGYPNRDGGESLKEAVSDGIRRCGRFVGIARDLYRRAPDERRGNFRQTSQPLTPAEQNAREREQLDAIRPPDDADSSPDAGRGDGKNKETEEMMGRVKRRGIIRKGTADNFKLTDIPGPDGHQLGFRLEIDGDKNIPQCAVSGPLGNALYMAAGGKPETLVGTVATVAGLLYNVRRPDKPGSWYRLHVDAIETDEWILPAPPDEPLLPAPPDDVPLLGEVPAA